MAGKLNFSDAQDNDPDNAPVKIPETNRNDTGNNTMIDPEYIRIWFATDTTTEHKHKRFEVWVSKEELELLELIKKKYSSSWSAALRIGLRCLIRELELDRS